jgi:hypothetical protein
MAVWVVGFAGTAFLLVPAAYSAFAGAPLYELSAAQQADFALWSEVAECFVTFGILASVAARCGCGGARARAVVARARARASAAPAVDGAHAPPMPTPPSATQRNTHATHTQHTHACTHARRVLRTPQVPPGALAAAV